MRCINRSAACVALGGVLAQCALAGTLEPGALSRLEFVGDAQISHDGKRIAYVVTRVDSVRDDYEGDIWLIDGETAPRRIVGGAADDTSPRWSPDAQRLAFLSNRAQKRQVFVIDLASGGEAEQLTHDKEGVSSFSWSPDGTRIAYVARNADPESASGALQPKGVRRAYITEQYMFRRDGIPGYQPLSRGRIWVTDARPGLATPVGPLTDGRTEPSVPLWLPDGKTLLFSATRGADADGIDAANDTELYQVAATAGATVRAITDRRGPDAQPAVSAQGHIAWTGFDWTSPMRSSTTTRLHVVDSPGAVPHVLTRSLDRNVGETLLSDSASPREDGPIRPAFSADGRSIYFIAADRGSAKLYEVTLKGGDIRSLSETLGGDMREFSVARNGRIAAVFGSSTRPYQIWTRENGASAWRQRTAHGEEVFADVPLQPAEESWVVSYDGTRIQYWLIRPPGFDVAKKYPLVLYIHGGPHRTYGDSFPYEFQVLANAGFLVLFANPRGSTGYGGDFANCIQYRYPMDDSGDLLAALDAVVARGFVDVAQLGVAGGSGGGILTSWLIGKTTRFRAAVVERAASNFSTLALSADQNFGLLRTWFRDLPWRVPGEIAERSPISLVDNVQTPVLVLHSEWDYRAPLDEGLQYYRALRSLGKPARLAILPASGHELSRSGAPSLRVERIEIILDWLKTQVLQGTR